MKVLRKIESEESKKEFLLLSGVSFGDSRIVLHIFIDNCKGEFTARKVKQFTSFDELAWEVQKGYTFPSSVFYEFIKEPLQDE